MKVLLPCLFVPLILTSIALALSPVPYNMVSSPNVNAPIGVVGIVPNRAGMNPKAAASLAKFARGQFRSVKTWKAIQIFVFRDLPTAQRFNAYQAKRKHWPLRDVDYRALQNTWTSVTASYEYHYPKGGLKAREKVLYPARNPSNWWRSLP